MIPMEKDQFCWIMSNAMVLKQALNTATTMIGEVTTAVIAKMLVSFVKVLWELIIPHNQPVMEQLPVETSDLSLTHLLVNLPEESSTSMKDNGEQCVMMDLPTKEPKLSAEVSDSHGRVQSKLTLMVVIASQSGWTMLCVREVRLHFWTVPEIPSETTTVFIARMLVSSVKEEQTMMA